MKGWTEEEIKNKNLMAPFPLELAARLVRILSFR
jgi:hypothetical protein